jgi:hypothetical protein
MSVEVSRVIVSNTIISHTTKLGTVQPSACESLWDCLWAKSHYCHWWCRSSVEHVACKLQAGDKGSPSAL